MAVSLELHDLSGPFQAKPFCDSMILLLTTEIQSLKRNQILLLVRAEKVILKLEEK